MSGVLFPRRLASFEAHASFSGGSTCANHSPFVSVWPACSPKNAAADVGDGGGREGAGGEIQHFVFKFEGQTRN